MTARKFTPGREVRTVGEAVRLILGGRWLYFRNKPLSPKWLANWSLCQITAAVGQGWLRVAREKEAPCRTS